MELVQIREKRMQNQRKRVETNMMQARHQISNAVIPVEKESVSSLLMTSTMFFCKTKLSILKRWLNSVPHSII